MWKVVSGFENYEVSENGEIRNRGTKHKLVPWEATGGYLNVALCKNGKKYTLRLHRIIATEFCKNPFNKPQVNHIDGNKKNNSSQNLEWCSQSENAIHAFRNGLQKRIGSHNVKRVMCVEDGTEFNTIRQASETYKIPQSTIYACCVRESNRSSYGKTFRFATERREE